MYKSLAETIREMKGLSHTLIPYSFPLTSHDDENDISFLKQRNIIVDGIEVGIHFNSCTYRKFGMESLQIFGKQFSFLPFSLVCKIARFYLGDKHLSLIEVLHGKNGNSCRKIYVWTIYYDKDGVILNPFSKEPKHESYGDFKFSRITEQEIKFF
jgi:hypothetical protein